MKKLLYILFLFSTFAASSQIYTFEGRAVTADGVPLIPNVFYPSLELIADGTGTTTLEMDFTAGECKIYINGEYETNLTSGVSSAIPVVEDDIITIEFTGGLEAITDIKTAAGVNVRGDVSSWGDMVMPNLISINVIYNNLTGDITNWTQNWESIKKISTINTKFTGDFGGWKIETLEILKTKGGELTGAIALVQSAFTQRTTVTTATKDYRIDDQNPIDWIYGDIELGDLGSFSGSEWDLTEQQVTNLSEGLDYTGSGTSEEWSDGNKVYWMSNAEISSTNTNKRYGTWSWEVDNIDLYDNLTFDFNERETDSLIIKDAINGNDAEIIGGVVADFDGNSHISCGDISGNDIEYIEITFKPSSLNNYDGIISGGITSTDRWLIRKTTAALQLEIAVTDGGATSRTIISYVDNEWMKIRVVKTGTTADVYVNGVYAKTVLGDYFKVVNISTISYIAAFLSGSGTPYSAKFEGNIETADFGGKFIYHLNGNSYNSIDGVEATWSGTEAYVNVTDYTPTSTLTALEEGYYKNNTTGEQVINPQYTLPTGWTAHDGGKLHNLIESYIDFNPTNSTATKFDIFDRSNTTIYNAICRDSEYYDSSNPFYWHISEINYDTWNSYLNSTYQDRNFAAIYNSYSNMLEVFRILNYNTPKTGTDLDKLKEYINY